MTEATAGYRTEQDVLGSFLNECTVSGTGIRAKASDLYELQEVGGRRKRVRRDANRSARTTGTGNPTREKQRNMVPGDRFAKF